jgi:hypothetical protein
MVGMGKEVLQKLAGIWGNFGLRRRRIGDSWGALRMKMVSQCREQAEWGYKSLQLSKSKREFRLNIGTAVTRTFKIRAASNRPLPALKDRVRLSQASTTVMLERRQESRKQLDIAVRISGRDVSGEPFAQSAVASSISGRGALLSGMERQVRTGDLVWVEYEERRARFRIVWVRDSESGRKTQAAIHRLENEACPWAGLWQLW